jgi:catalase
LSDVRCVGPRHLSQGVERFIQERAVNDYWSKVDPDLGARVAQGLGLGLGLETLQRSRQ